MGKRKRARWKKIKDADLATLQHLLTPEPAHGPRSLGPTESQISHYRVEKWKQHAAPNPAMLRHTLTTESYTVFQWGDIPGSIYAMHKHDEDQSHWMVSGSLELTVERYGTFVLETGDRDFMPAGTYHSARVLGDEPAVYLVGEKRKA